MRQPASLSAFVGRFLIALSLALVAFGHQPLAVQENSDLSAYALPDGSLPTFCLGSEDGAGGGHGTARAICAACLLTASFLLPQPPAGGVPDIEGVRYLPAMAEAQLLGRPAFSPSAPPTAPPLA